VIEYTPGIIRSMTSAVGVPLAKEMAARRLGASNPCAVGVTRLGSPGPSASPVTKIVAGTRRASMSSIVGRAARSARDRAGRVTTESRGKSKDANTECSFRCRDTTSLGEVLVLFPYIANHPGNGQQKYPTVTDPGAEPPPLAVDRSPRTWVEIARSP